MTDNVIPENAIDFDAILAKRQEEVGSRDRFPLVFAGQTWWVMDPTLADDTWTEELRDLGYEQDEDGNVIEDDEGNPIELDSVDTVALVEHYLGTKQWEKFREAGGQSSYVLQALKIHLERQSDKDADGRPTQRSRSSRAIRRRSKRR
ncbi:hypothetical protein [Prescottella equi]|uniref:Tail assembly chaperone n=1 Tax=Prescottella equi ATCC 33707 TaxID=525370 RepID=E9T069_RHOHA|nr:hypothetical protein [Prescottella equi]EGD24652.1 hypothetical protein HMPREF0724_11770 [Prescottella equi ATCC 33707]